MRQGEGGEGDRNPQGSMTWGVRHPCIMAWCHPGQKMRTSSQYQCQKLCQFLSGVQCNEHDVASPAFAISIVSAGLELSSSDPEVFPISDSSYGSSSTSQT